MKKTIPFFFIFSLFFMHPLWASDLVPEDTPHIKVLSWDGGGVRGLFSLYVAQAVDDYMGGDGNLVEKADWLVGTSTGGIIALALGSGSTLQEAIDLYKHNGRQIFKKEGWSLWRKIQSLWEETYTDTGLVQQLHRTLGADTTFKDLTKNVVVTSYDLLGGNKKHPAPYIFNSNDLDLQTVKIWKAARSTSAAPTYFDPYCGFEGHVLVDGGIIANHPGNVGVDEILSLYPLGERDETLAQIDMVSFGTGVFYDPMTPQEANNMGKLEWAGPISGVMMQGASKLVDESLQIKLGNRYVRLNAILDRKIPLDGVSPDELQALETLALTYIKNNSETIDRAAQLMQ